MAEQETDIHNFSTSSSHRLPTISGTQALQNELKKARGISTSLPTLDRLLGPNSTSTSSPGVRRGHVTEIYGPPGVGKTTLGIQLAINAIRSLDSDSKAIWISAGSPLVRDRVEALNNGYDAPESLEPPSTPPQPRSNDQVLDENFMYIETQSLARLLTILMHPTSVFPPPTTAIVVVDDLSNLIFGSFPRLPRAMTTINAALQDKLAQRAAGRRFQILENLSSALSRLAASRHLAVVVLSNASTSLKGGQKAALKPALSGQVWDPAIHTRILLYRDFSPSEQRSKLTSREKKGYRLAALVRSSARDVFREAVPFTIEDDGLHELTLDVPAEPEPTPANNGMPRRVPTAGCPTELLPLPVPSSPTNEAFQLASQLPLPEDERPTKRKAAEIADSEDEDENDIRNAEVESNNELCLPPIEASILRNPDEVIEDEMLLDTHERGLR